MFDNAHAVAEWAIAGPAISKLLETENINRTRTHHEDTKQFESKFIKDCTALHQAFETWGNPFEEEEPGLVQYTTKLVMSEKEERSVKEARYLGLKQYQEFDQNRKSLYNPIRKNKLPLFRQKNTVVASNKKQQAISMKERVNLFQDLYIGCKVRANGDLAKFFAHENHYYPPSLSEYGKLRHPSSKSDFLQCLKGVTDQQFEVYTRPVIDAAVIDGAPWIHLHPPRTSLKFGEYSTVEVVTPLFELPVKRLDVVFDVYNRDALKREERERRGQQSVRYLVRKDTLIPKNFATTIMRNDQSKTTV